MQRTIKNLRTIAFITPFLCFFFYLQGYKERHAAVDHIHNMSVADALPAYLP